MAAAGSALHFTATVAESMMVPDAWFCCDPIVPLSGNHNATASNDKVNSVFPSLLLALSYFNDGSMHNIEPYRNALRSLSPDLNFGQQLCGWLEHRL